MLMCVAISVTPLIRCLSMHLYVCQSCSLSSWCCWQLFSWSCFVWTHTHTFCHFKQVRWGNKFKHHSFVHLMLPHNSSLLFTWLLIKANELRLLATVLSSAYLFVLHLYIDGRVAQQLYLGFAFTASDDWQWQRCYKRKPNCRSKTSWHLLLSYILSLQCKYARYNVQWWYLA